MTEYKKIVAVTGLPGLYELISSKTDGAIVRSLEDKNTRFISSRIYKATQLETIEVFTIKDNVNLMEIFKAMEASDDQLPDEKDSTALHKYFKKNYPDLDFEKVYASDMKKMIKWFAILNSSHIELKLSEPPSEELSPQSVEEPAAEPVAKPVAEQKEEAVVKKKEKVTKPKKTAAKKKTESSKKASESEKKEKPKKTASKTKSKK